MFNSFRMVTKTRNVLLSMWDSDSNILDSSLSVAQLQLMPLARRYWLYEKLLSFIFRMLIWKWITCIPVSKVSPWSRSALLSPLLNNDIKLMAHILFQVLKLYFLHNDPLPVICHLARYILGALKIKIMAIFYVYVQVFKNQFRSSAILVVFEETLAW